MYWPEHIDYAESIVHLSPSVITDRPCEGRAGPLRCAGCVSEESSLSGCLAPILITSIAPWLPRGTPPDVNVGRAYQQRCARSWYLAGARVISLNPPEEIESLQVDFPWVEFVSPSALDAAPKGAPRISDLLRVGVNLAPGSVFAIANSDVEFLGSADVLGGLNAAAVGGVVFGCRSERALVELQPGPLYTAGFDVFFCDNRFVTPAEMDGFTLGSPWWDYLFPYQLAAREVPLMRIFSPVVGHLSHAAVWDNSRWKKGLSNVVRVLREQAEEEGPSAAVFAHLLRNLLDDVSPGFAISEIINPLGAAVGLAMLEFIGNRCHAGVWIERGGGSHSRAGDVRVLPIASASEWVERAWFEPAPAG